MSKEQLKSEIEKILGLTNVDLDNSIHSLMEDSLELFEAIILVEDALDINIVVDFKLVTFGDFVNLVYNSRIRNGSETVSLI